MQQYQQHQHLSIFSSNIRVVDKLRAGWIGMSKSPPKLQSSDIQSKFLGFFFFNASQDLLKTSQQWASSACSTRLQGTTRHYCPYPPGGIGILLIRILLHKGIEKMTWRDARGRRADSPEEPALMSFAEWLWLPCTFSPKTSSNVVPSPTQTLH